MSILKKVMEAELKRKAKQGRKKKRPQPKREAPPLEAKRERISDKKISDPVRPRRKPTGPKVPPAPPRNQRRKPGPITGPGGRLPKVPTTKLPEPPRGQPKRGTGTVFVPPAPPRGPIGSKKAPPTPRMPPAPRMPPKPKVDPNRFISVADFERSGGLGKGPAKGTPKKPKQEPVMIPGTRTPMTKTGKLGGMYGKYPQRPGDFNKGGAVRKKSKPRGVGVAKRGFGKALK